MENAMIVVIGSWIISFMIGFFVAMLMHNYWCDWKNKYEKLQIKLNKLNNTGE